MSFVYFIKLVLKNIFWLLALPAGMSVTIFYFTRHEQKVYSSESVIYTGIASGYNLNGDTKSDFFATSNAFDNLLSLINSRETKQEVAINLLARHLMIQKHDPALLSWESFDELRKLVPDSVRKIVVMPTTEETVLAVTKYLNRGEENLVYAIINSENPYYSLSALDNIKALRINNSDLIRISYQTNDAVICKETLELLETCFINKHRKLKEGQSESVVTYFETQSKLAYARLNDAEQTFMQFNKSNDIINYYEQTKAVAVEKESLDAQKHNIEMDKMASKKSLDKVNEDMKGRLYQNEYGTQILKTREVLADVYSRIEVGNLIGRDDPNHRQQIDSLKKISTELESKLAGSVNNLYLETLTPNGIPTKSVLDEWLKTSLDFEQSNARLTVMEDRRKEFTEQYRKYAPLGATLKKIERQINVSEQEYLELLHGLNTAKLTQQNNELTTKLNIVDKPFVPLKANPSKRMLQVILGFIVGFIAVLFVILARALANRTLKQPDNARKLTGIPLLGIYPLLNTGDSFTSSANRRLAQQLLARINPGKQTVMIGIVSIQHQEGKSTITEKLYKELAGLDYVVESKLWNNGTDVNSSTCNIELIEFPALVDLVIRPGMLPALDHTLLVCRANRVWSKMDSEVLDLFIKTTGNKPSLILNGVEAVFAEEYIGEMARSRFFIRSFFKRVMKSQFGNRKKINQ